MTRQHTPDASLLDLVAEAMFHAQMRNQYGDDGGEESYHWRSVPPGRKQMYREMAQAALRAMGEQAAREDVA